MKKIIKIDQTLREGLHPIAISFWTQIWKNREIEGVLEKLNNYLAKNEFVEVPFYPNHNSNIFLILYQERRI